MRNEYIKIFLKHILTYSLLDVYLWIYDMCFDKTLKIASVTRGYGLLLCALLLGFLLCYTVRDFVVVSVLVGG